MGFQWNDVALTPVGQERSMATARDVTTCGFPLLGMSPGNTRVVCSSMTRAWRGLLLEKHASSPSDRPSCLIDRHVLSMVTGAPLRFEHRSFDKPFVSCLNRAGTITVTPAGPAPELRFHTDSELIHCALDKEFAKEVAESLDRRPAVAARFHPGIQDKSIQRIIGMLFDELEAQVPMGRLYVDSLAHALALRYLLLDSNSDAGTDQRVSRLPVRILNRLKEKIEANLDTDLTLESLSGESGYSRAHFLRMFRAATGMTPHQYVLELRVRRAQEYLRQKGASISDVAVSCGFSSQSHMTSVFRQRLETTPAEFRRLVS